MSLGPEQWMQQMALATTRPSSEFPKGGLTFAVDGVAAGTSNYFVPWHRSASYYLSTHGSQTSEDLFVSRVLPDGRVLGSHWSSPLFTTYSTLDLLYGSASGVKLNGAAAAWVNGSCLVVWGTADVTGAATGGNVYARIVSADGTLGPLTTVESGSARVETIASDGVTAQLIWQSGTLASGITWTPGTVHSTHISGQGTVLADASGSLGPGASIAWNGSEYLQVWASGGSVLGARIDATGALMDTTPVTLVPVAASFAPRVAGHDGEFLVAWTDATKGTSDYDVYALRIGNDGAVLGPAPIPIRTTTSSEVAASVTSGSSGFLVRYAMSGSVWATPVAFDGTVLGSTASASGYVAHGDNRFLLASGNTAVMEEEDGTVLSNSVPAYVTALDDRSWPHVTWGGGQFLVSWSQDEGFPKPSSSIGGSAIWDTWQARMGVNALFVDSRGKAIPSAGPALWDGTQFVTVAAYSNAAYRSSPDGTVLDTTMVAVPGRLAASNGSGTLFFNTSGQRQFFDTNLQPVGSLSVDALSPACTPVSVGWDGNDYIVACKSGSTLYGDIIAPDGTQAASQLIDSDSAGAQVASGQGRTLFAWWSSTTGVHAEVRDRNLVSIGPPISISLQGAVLRALWDGTAFFILWQESKNLFSARVSADGALLSPIFSIASNATGAADLASDGSGITAFIYTTTDPDGAIRGKIRLLTPATTSLDAGTDSGATGGAPGRDSGSIGGSGGTSGTGTGTSNGGTGGSYGAGGTMSISDASSAAGNTGASPEAGVGGARVEAGVGGTPEAGVGGAAIEAGAKVDSGSTDGQTDGSPGGATGIGGFTAAGGLTGTSSGGSLGAGGLIGMGGLTGTGAVTSTGGTVGGGFDAGTASSGGTAASGGVTGSGGFVQVGGAAQTGGDASAGGSSATGGAPSTGGVGSMGGASNIGTDGSMGGSPGVGGTSGTGGLAQAGGAFSSGGHGNGGGPAGTGGAAGGGGAPSTGGVSGVPIEAGAGGSAPGSGGVDSGTSDAGALGGASSRDSSGCSVTRPGERRTSRFEWMILALAIAALERRRGPSATASSQPRPRWPSAFRIRAR